MAAAPHETTREILAHFMRRATANIAIQPLPRPMRSGHFCRLRHETSGVAQHPQGAPARPRRRSWQTSGDAAFRFDLDERMCRDGWVTNNPRPYDVQAQFQPSLEWLEQLAAQCTPQLLERLARYAGHQIAQTAKFGYAVDSYAAREFVQDAVHDTVTGVVHWDPHARTLEHHLVKVLRVRCKRMRMRAEAAPRMSLDASPSEPSMAAMMPVVATPDTSNERGEAALSRLRAHALGDDQVMRMLDAIAAGAQTRDDIVHLTRMSFHEYHNARRRLARLVERLGDPQPDEQCRRGA